MTLLREIQLLLERTYAPVPINLEECLIDDRRCEALTRLAGPEAAALAPSGRTFLRQESGRLYLAIYYAAPLIAELEANDPRRALNERNIAPVITFIEEIAHGMQAALLFLEGERTVESEDYARNLEAQARVDTYLVLSKLAQLICGGKIPRRVGTWLLNQVFSRDYRHFEHAPLRARYRAAQGCARRFLQRLRTTPLSERIDVLRAFRALSWPDKLAYVRAV